MESDLRYFRRRAVAEQLAAKRSVTPEARDRHLELAEKYIALVLAGECLPSAPRKNAAAA